MAYTKIHAIKATVNKAINYITNPAKTDGKMLVDSFACSPESADKEFEFSLNKTMIPGSNKAFHLIQSFLPGEVSYNEAHAIGQELADRLLQGKYSYVIATHIDHNHIHNHIVFCAADNIDHRKYDDNKRSYHHIRQLSDELCKEHNLSIINPGKKRGMKYNEWAARKEGTSWKQQLQTDIDETIKSAASYENFIELLKARGYEIKGEELGEGTAKYIAFRPLEGKQFVRGSARSLGEDYTKEKIQERINENLIAQSRSRIPFPQKIDPFAKISTKSVEELINKPQKNLAKDPRTSLIDTSTERMQSSPGLLRYANVQNLKAAAHAYALMEDLQSVQARIEEKRELIKTTKSSLVSLEKKMKPAAEILHYANIYKSNLRYHNAFTRSKDPDRYYRDHDTNLNLFNAAEHVLMDKYNINPALMNYQYMQESYRLMEEKKASLSSLWKREEKELHTLESQLETLQKYMNQGAADSIKSHVQEEERQEETKQPEAEEKAQAQKKEQTL